MIRVLLYGEGPGDIGKKEYDRKKGELQSDGALQVFIRRCAPETSFEFETITRGDIKKYMPLSKANKRISAKQTEAYKLAGLAKLKNCTHVAYHMDEDKQGYDTRLETVENKLQVSLERNLKCLPIVAQRMIESWLMSDEQAYPEIPTNPELPKNPEEIWGDRDDPKSNHPHRYMNRVLGQFDKAPSHTEYADLAQRTDVETARRKCPVSFDRFYQAVQEFIAE